MQRFVFVLIHAVIAITFAFMFGAPGWAAGCVGLIVGHIWLSSNGS